jgi:hypothetical protein
MYSRKVIVGWAVGCLVVLLSTGGRAQSAGPAMSQGQLTVTATVVSSIGVVIGEDGQARLVVANAPGVSAQASTVTSDKPSQVGASGLLGSNVTLRDGNVTQLEDTKRSSKVFGRFVVCAAPRRILLR